MDGSLRRVPVVVVALAGVIGCGYPRPPDVEGDGGAAGDSAAGNACFGSFLKICLPATPTVPLTISTPSNIETDSPLCASVVSGGDRYCVIAASDIAINATLRATGTKPLVLIATRSIVTTALIDVGSYRDASPRLGIGAGGNPGACGVGTPPAAGGGGPGGSFVGVGGVGGFGSNGAAGGSPASAVAEVTELRGGCAGQKDNSLITGGHGGGAVFLIAGERIDIRGGIHASGAGALGSSGGSNGGYGGGSGGMIGFEAPSITCNSQLLASGGGGGGGSSGVSTGLDGQDPHTIVAVLGGPGAHGGSGGNGSEPARAAPGMAGSPGDPTGIGGGGGGGGGGAGVIKAPAGANLGNQVSPPPTR